MVAVGRKENKNELLKAKDKSLILEEEHVMENWRCVCTYMLECSHEECVHIHLLPYWIRIVEGGI